LETLLLKVLNTRDSVAALKFGTPLYSDYLLWEVRIPAERRSLLKPDSPSEKLERYFLLTYDTVEAANRVLKSIRDTKGLVAVEQDQKLKFASVPYNDPYAQWPGPYATAATYQWGHYAMNFLNISGQGAHDVHQGHGYVGVMDGLGSNSTGIPADVNANMRQHLSGAVQNATDAYNLFHGTFVNSIVAAKANNGSGIAGACPDCSLLLQGGGSVAGAAQSLNFLSSSGAPVVNMSFGTPAPTSVDVSALDTAILTAQNRDVVMFAASGNENLNQPNYPARNPRVMSVGGSQQNSPSGPWLRWVDSPTGGSNFAGINGVMGPAKHVVSLSPGPGVSFVPGAAALSCGDGTSPFDISGPAYDGVAACTGTSFATPYVSALGGILRSINPRLSRNGIYSAIRSASSTQSAPNSEYGSGIPNALTAVNNVLGQTPNRLTPLFSMWSAGRSDYFYTTVPQMASAAWNGRLMPIYNASDYYASGIGNSITGYNSFPQDGGTTSTPTAGAWIFTTRKNPVNAAAPLVPLYRLSWKCGDYTPTPPAVCSSNPNHMDTTYTTDQAGVNAFVSWGYKLDGIEGFIYPKSAAQPIGTVRLMRKYSTSRDDHAIFPETELYSYATQGYSQNSGSDWLGYVYPNSTGATPAVQ
jgi:serine protease